MSDGLVDLSVGTPVDPVPERRSASARCCVRSPGVSDGARHGGASRGAAVEWMRRRLGVSGVDADAVVPAIGTKELVARLPLLLGLGAGSRVMVPELAYPTYDIGARVVGAEVVASDSTMAVGPGRVDLVWLNSPGNPTGRVLPAEHLRKVVTWARERGADRACRTSATSSSAGMRSRCRCFTPTSAATSPTASWRCTRCRSGRTWPAIAPDSSPVMRRSSQCVARGAQAPRADDADAGAGSDDRLRSTTTQHVVEQRRRYAARRQLLLAALREAGFTVEHSEAGLYLWVTRDEPCMDTVTWFAERGVLVAPGDFYGARGARHVRVALTASDERVEAGGDERSPDGPAASR